MSPNPQHTTFNVVPAPNPAGPGNRRAVRHGAFSDSLINPRAREIAEEVLHAHPHLDADRDGPALQRYAVALARVERVNEWLNEQDDPDFSNREAGVTHPVLDRLSKWESQCDMAEHRLGLSPLQRVKLGLATAQAIDVASAMSEPDPALRAQLLRRVGLIDSGGDDRASEH